MCIIRVHLCVSVAKNLHGIRIRIIRVDSSNSWLGRIGGIAIPCRAVHVVGCFLVAWAFREHRAPLPFCFLVVAAFLASAARLRRVRWP